MGTKPGSQTYRRGDTYTCEEMVELCDEAREEGRQELAQDKKRLDWLESECEGGGLISDDFGNWSLSGSGYQNVTDENDNPPTAEKPIDIQTTFFVEASEWRGNIRSAIDAVMEED